MNDDLLLAAILDCDIGTIANIVQAASENEGSLFDRLSKAYYELTNQDPVAEHDLISLAASIDMDPNELRARAIELLEETRSEPEIECAHCSGVPDGTIAVHTDTFDRDHRICNKCATEMLRWL